MCSSVRLLIRSSPESMQWIGIADVGGAMEERVLGRFAVILARLLLLHTQVVVNSWITEQHRRVLSRLR